MVAVLRAKDLRKIFEYLESKIDTNDLSFLRKLAPGLWEEYPDNAWEEKEKYKEWIKKNLSNSVRVSFLIQTIVDAKLREFSRIDDKKTKDRSELQLSYSNGLPKKCLMEIAEILSIKGFENSHSYKDCNTNRFELANLIIKELSE